MNFAVWINLLFLLIPFLGMLLLYVLTNAYLLRMGKLPLQSFASRRPAQSKQLKLRQQQQIYFVLLFFIPLMLGLGFYTVKINGFANLTVIMKAVVTGYAVVALTALLLLLRCLKKISQYSLTIDTEQGVAHLLSGIVKQGFTIHHDAVLGKQMTVPHIAVSQAGVFLVNVLVQGRPFFNKQAEAIRAKYFNGRFIFPNGKNKKIIKASEEMAAALQTRLSKAAGTSIAVKCILTLPGWYLEKKEKAPIIILPVKQVDAFIGTFADKTVLDEFTVEKVNECISHLSSDIG